MKPQNPDQIDARIDAGAMLDQVQSWCAINTGTANVDGLAKQAKVLAEAFSALPGEVELVDPAPVTAIAADGSELGVVALQGRGGLRVEGAVLQFGVDLVQEPRRLIFCGVAIG